LANLVFANIIAKSLRESIANLLCRDGFEVTLTQDVVDEVGITFLVVGHGCDR
jgi:hypothetical protein